nr:hypothetical protein CFP56_38977 [Quercus suber]
MTSRSPSSCLYAVSSITITNRHATNRLILKSSSPRVPTSFLLRNYVTRPRQPSKAIAVNSQPVAVARQPAAPPARAVQAVDHGAYSPRAALLAVESGNLRDVVNPPSSTLPPPLELPRRESGQNVFLYLYRLGSAYGTFYKNGVKAVWYNRKAARLLQGQIKQRAQKYRTDAKDKSDTALQGLPDSQLLPAAASWGLMTRTESEILARNDRDIAKLPLFGILAVVLGEWLPLIVPFMPSVVPGTCLIPSQTEGMRKAAEERRKTSFRRGIRMPVDGTREKLLQTASDSKQAIFQALRHEQLLHVSTVLGLHKRFWDRLSIMPPSFLLRASLTRRWKYLAQDDFLLLKHGGVARLSSQELAIACELRGIDVLHRSDAVLREVLNLWLKNQQKGELAFLDMLFQRFVSCPPYAVSQLTDDLHRPNAWEGRSQLGSNGA